MLFFVFPAFSSRVRILDRPLHRRRFPGGRRCRLAGRGGWPRHRHLDALPGTRGPALGHRRPDRNAARQGGGAAAGLGGRAATARRRHAHRRLPDHPQAALAGRARRLDQGRRHRPARRHLPGRVLLRGVAHLGQPGHACHDRRHARHRARRRAGTRAAPGGLARRRADRAGPGRPWPASRAAGRGLQHARRPRQRRHGAGRVRGVRDAHADRLGPGARTRRRDRHRTRVHRWRTGAAAARSRRWPGIPAHARGIRLAGGTGHRAHRGGLHALLPRPARCCLRAPARCFRCSSRSRRCCSARRSSATGSARPGWRAPPCSPRRSR